MSNKLPSEKINQLWKAFQERQTIRYVCQKCNINRRTAERYRKLERWDERFEKIKQQVQEKVDMKQAEENARFIQIAQRTINLYEESLAESVVRICPKCKQEIQISMPKNLTPADFSKMVRLIKDELAEKEKTKEAAGENITLDELSLETRKAILHEIKQKYKKNEQNQ